MTKMKNIRLPIRGIIEPTPGSPINMGVAKNNLELARDNGQKVIVGALAIERQLEDNIMHYFSFDDKNKVKFFKNNILSTDWFSFSAKRKVVLNIIRQENLVTGKSKSEIESNLSKIMKYRNAFTHGDIVEKSDGTYIQYFEGSPKKKKLTDKFWTNIEIIFGNTFNQLNNIISLLSNT